LSALCRHYLRPLRALRPIRAILGAIFAFPYIMIHFFYKATYKGEAAIPIPHGILINGGTYDRFLASCSSHSSSLFTVEVTLASSV
jgi:hypothetical protein